MLIVHRSAGMKTNDVLTRLQVRKRWLATSRSITWRWMIWRFSKMTPSIQPRLAVAADILFYFAANLTGRSMGLARLFVHPSVCLPICPSVPCRLLTRKRKGVGKKTKLFERSASHELPVYRFLAQKVRGQGYGCTMQCIARRTAAQYVGTLPTYFSSFRQIWTLDRKAYGL